MTRTVFAGWLSNWEYRKPITISNSGSGLTDYQVLITNPIYDETGLISSWHFNENSGNTISDSSSSGNIGTMQVSANWVNGKFGKGMNLIGFKNTLYWDGEKWVPINTIEMGVIGFMLLITVSFLRE